MQPGGAEEEEEVGGAGDEDTQAPARDGPVKTEESQVGRQLARTAAFMAFRRFGGGHTDTPCTYVLLYIFLACL